MQVSTAGPRVSPAQRQSLVYTHVNQYMKCNFNWFCWWYESKVTQYKLHIIGSNQNGNIIIFCQYCAGLVDGRVLTVCVLITGYVVPRAPSNTSHWVSKQCSNRHGPASHTTSQTVGVVIQELDIAIHTNKRALGRAECSCYSQHDCCNMQLVTHVQTILSTFKNHIGGFLISMFKPVFQHGVNLSS